MACLCGRCQPNDIPVNPWRCACSRCGQEVRFGVVGDVKGWHHRQPVGHVPVLGHVTPIAPVVDRGPEGQPIEDMEAVYDDVQPLRHLEVGDLPSRSGVRQVANLVERQDGWELISLTHCRGPWINARGQITGISDSHVLRARCRRICGPPLFAIGSWRDLRFDFAYIGFGEHYKLNMRRVDARTMKGWIKGDDAAGLRGEPG